MERITGNRPAARLGMLLLIILAHACTRPESPALQTGYHHLPQQQFVLESDQARVISTASGAFFAIPAHAFTDSLGNPVTGRVDFRIREANTSLSIFAAGLETRSGDDLLATGGMYLLEAFQEGRRLKLDPAAGIYAYLPPMGDQPDPAMNLYRGAWNSRKLDWELTDQAQGGIPECDRNAETRRKCKRCERLLQMAQIKTGSKPQNEEELWSKRYYWDKGKLYFASSGSARPILSEAQVNECRDWLEGNEKGRELLGMLDQVRQEQLADLGNYYQYRLNALGWYNIDKLKQDELITFRGRVVDAEGKPLDGATVHMMSVNPELRVHTIGTCNQGEFSFQFVAGQEINLYAYAGRSVGKLRLTLRSDGESVGDLRLTALEPGSLDTFLEDLM